MHVSHSTLANNAGVTIWNNDATTGNNASLMTLKNTILVKGSGSNCSSFAGGVSQGHNLSDDGLVLASSRKVETAITSRQGLTPTACRTMAAPHPQSRCSPRVRP